MGLAFPAIPQELLADTKVSATLAAETLTRLAKFAKSFAPCFTRSEQGTHCRTYLEGLMSDLHRKSIEPIATAHCDPRRPLQRFVGAGKWDDTDPRDKLLRRVASEIGDPQGVLVLDSSGFTKKGKHSVGVARQWNGRLGKIDNCQVGVFISYCGRGSATLVDADLYLPHEWTRSRARLDHVHVPRDIGFRSKIEIAKQRLEILSPALPHAWVTGDDEFGRPAHFRRWLRRRKETYLLDVPSNTVIRDLEAPPPRPLPGRRGPHSKAPFQSVEAWTKSLPPRSWTRVLVHDGEKGPIEVEAASCRVRTKHQGRLGPREVLLVTRTLEKVPDVRYSLTNAPATTPREVLTRVAGARHHIEESFEVAKGDLGMHHYEVRSWVGWHHHMTMLLLAQWFLTLEHRRLGEKISGADRPDDRAASEEAVA
jgi:SRSO17 transposase